jgi:hypothetical protein
LDGCKSQSPEIFHAGFRQLGMTTIVTQNQLGFGRKITLGDYQLLWIGDERQSLLFCDDQQRTALKYRKKDD